MSNFISEFVVENLQSDKNESFSQYYAALRNACEFNPPPYGENWFGKEYRRMSRDPSWFANLLISDADLEGYSSKQLWIYANSVSDSKMSQDLKLHAIDEARHSKIFGKLLFLIFPSSATNELSEKLKEMSPSLSLKDIDNSGSNIVDMSHQEILNSLILINLFEIKALVLQRLLQPTLFAYGNSELNPRIQRSTNSLIADEIRHVSYTAGYLESAIKTGHRDYIFSAMSEFQKYLNHITLEQFQAA